MTSKIQENSNALQIAALTEDSLEPVADLAATAQEVLFVMADTLRGEDVGALAAYKERLREARGRPFLIRACHRHSEDSGPEGLFDLTVICGRESDLPLSLPAEMFYFMLCGEFPLERKELLRPGRLMCFSHSAIWGDCPTKEVDELCRALRRELDTVRAEDKAPSRYYICVTATPDVTMDELDQCMTVLTNGGIRPSGIVFQMVLSTDPPKRIIHARGMIETGA